MKKLNQYNWDNIAESLDLVVIYITEKDICLMSRGSHARIQLNIYDRGKDFALTQTLPKMEHFGFFEYADIPAEEIINVIKERMKDNG